MIREYKEIKSKVDSVQGYLYDPQPEYLFNRIFRSPLDSEFIEIGSYFGKSSVAMGYACIDTNRKIYCIDPWENKMIYEDWKKVISLNGLDKYVFPLVGWSGDILVDLLKTKLGSIEGIFIDGSHAYPNALRDFILSYHLLKDQGWVVFHDVCDEFIEMKQVWEVVKPLLMDYAYCGSIASGRKIHIK